MSFVISLKVPCDTAVFQKALDERADEIKAVADKARAQGCLHHRFGIGEGFVHVVDEWETVEGFQSFFTEPSMQEFIATIGADTSVQPEMTVSQAISSPDQF
jgi:quinol monooxygenase YgiN